MMATWLEEHGVELVVLAGYMHLLTKPFLDRFPERIVNVHPSLLPSFPGAHAIEDALAAGVAETGVTVHVVDEGLDTGPGPRAGGRPGRAARDARGADPRGRAPPAPGGRPRAADVQVTTCYSRGSGAMRALLSVWDKNGLDEFARGLAGLGLELVSSGGTARPARGGRARGDARRGGDRRRRRCSAGA